MLKKLYVDNFRCLVNFEIEFKNLTLLMGGNGSGKSAVFEVLRRLREVVVGATDVRVAFPSSTKTRWLDNPRQVFELHLEMDDGRIFKHTLVLCHNSSESGVIIEKEALEIDSAVIDRFSYIHRAGRPPSRQSRAQLISMFGEDQDALSLVDKFKGLLTISLNIPAISPDSEAEAHELDQDGANFVSWYRHISHEYQDKAFELTTTLREVLPGFRAFRLIQSGSEHRTLQVGFGEEGGETLFYRFDELSGGQKALIILYALVGATGGLGYTLFLDEPENFLQLSEIQPWLMALKDACDSKISQAVLISHHPELIDYLGAEAGIWLTRSPSGATRIGCYTPPPDSGLKLSEQVARGWTE